MPSSGSDLKNRRAETAYLGTMRALKLLEGELAYPRLQERSCWDCWNSDALVALTLVAQSMVQSIATTCQLQLFCAMLITMWSPWLPEAFLLNAYVSFFIPGLISSFISHCSSFFFVVMRGLCVTKCRGRA